MAEEEYLIQELRKIETRKKEREKKAQDLQKLIKAADTTTELRRAEKRVSKKKLPQKRETEKPVWHSQHKKEQKSLSSIVNLKKINMFHYSHVIAAILMNELFSAVLLWND